MPIIGKVRRHRGRHRVRRRGGRTPAVAFVAVALTVAPAVAVPEFTAPGTATNWSGIWMSTTAEGTGTSLATVRSIIGADKGTAAALTGQGVGIALIDTGVSPVPGLPAGQIVNGPDLSFESQDPDLRYLDTYGHGTHMAGIMVADDAATGAKGLAPKAKVTSIKVGTSNGAVDVSQVIAAIDWVVKNRNHDPANPIRVLNLAYGTGGNPVSYTDPVQFAVEKAWAAGIVVVAAAGNQGNGYGKLTDPATDPFIIAVGATATRGTVTVADDQLATFTNIGPHRPMDTQAPGDSIQSLRVPGSNIDQGYPGARISETLFKGSGTSQAAAVTSAAVALMLQAKPTLTPDQVKYLVKNGGTYVPNGLQSVSGVYELNVSGALALTARNTSTQRFMASSGAGLLENARGTSHVIDNGVRLTGEASIFGPWDSAAWAARSAAQTSWSGGTWMGHTIAGDGWTGQSWAGKTWGAATWSTKPWGGSATWIDPNWSGRFWAGRFWAGGTWVARFWASDDWSTAHWG